MWIDKAGNLIGLIRGERAREDAATRVMTHMDELSMLVKRVESDGTLHLTQLGTMYPGNFGLGPISVLGDRERLIGVLSLGSQHTTKESPKIWQTQPDGGDKAMDWTHVYVSPAAAPTSWRRRASVPAPACASNEASGPLSNFGDYLG
jgi:putative aminopeptidase FrvX